LIRFENVHKRYDGGREALAGVTFNIERGELAFLTGPSGAGKSTVLRTIAGLTRPDSGRIALGKTLWFDSETNVDLRPEERSVGLVFQDYALFPHMSVADNVAYGGGRKSAELLARFGIE